MIPSKLHRDKCILGSQIIFNYSLSQMVHASVSNKGGHQHLAAALITTSNTRNCPAGAMQSAGEHASSWMATELPAAFWWAGEASLHLCFLHSPVAYL